jgi:hypothetical protein
MNMKCPICGRVMTETAKEVYYCGVCKVYIKIEEDAHGQFCEDFRKFTESPAPPPRREDP